MLHVVDLFNVYLVDKSLLCCHLVVNSGVSTIFFQLNLSCFLKLQSNLLLHVCVVIV